MLTWRPPSTTEPLRVAVPVSDPFLSPDLGMLLADRFGQLGLHHLAHHDEPGGRRERQETVLERPGHLGQSNGGLERQASEAICLLHLRDAHDG